MFSCCLNDTLGRERRTNAIKPHDCGVYGTSLAVANNNPNDSKVMISPKQAVKCFVILLLQCQCM